MTERAGRIRLADTKLASYEAQLSAGPLGRLVPPALAARPAAIGLRANRAMDYGSKYRGCLVGGAIGDALGRPLEGRHLAGPIQDLDSLRAYRPWRGWREGPVGTVTDDTQLTRCVAETLVQVGYLDPADLATRFVAWLPLGRGKGHATTEAVARLCDGAPWHAAGTASAGNGAAMRVGPIGLLRAEAPDLLRREAMLSAVITHADASAVAAAIAQAFVAAYCLHVPAGTLDPARLLSALSRSLDDLWDPQHLVSWLEPPVRLRMRDRLAEVGSLLDATPASAFSNFRNGPFVFQSLPAALWCFLRYRDEPERAILTAMSGGYDADTVAAMTGTMVGAYHGVDAFPRAWLDDLEYRPTLEDLADALRRQAGLTSESTASPALPDGGTGVRASDDRIGGPVLDRTSRILGCLLGGAIGDALGAPVEFDSLRIIRARFGPDGLVDYFPHHGRRGAITDDTQMTLFTAEGLIRGFNRLLAKGISSPAVVLWSAYQRWRYTQGGRPHQHWESTAKPDGWLVHQPVLHHRRAPGPTCLSALQGHRPGSPTHPLNGSKGCGGIMRIAPVGLVMTEPFSTGVEGAALTHGHPSGYLAAGTFAMIIGELTSGSGLRAAIETATARLSREASDEETLMAVEGALALVDAHQRPSPELVETLGEGWVAEEALAIALYCALVAPDFRAAVLLAVNHGGDSDSTGSLTGQLLGALLGMDALPPDWVRDVEARPVIERIGTDLATLVDGGPIPGYAERDRYPGW